MATLQIIVGSTRPGRVGLPVARWFEERARLHGLFEVDFVDLAEFGLPLLDEPKHPRFHDYQHEHTKRWSERIERGDAYAWVMPEYNHGMAAAMKNGIDYLNQEWRHKPVGIVSYGGVGAGTRAAQQAKVSASALGMVPAAAGVPIPFVKNHIRDGGSIEANDEMNDGAESMLDELHRMAAVLAPLREPAPA